MNRKNLMLTLIVSLLLIGVAGVRLTSEASAQGTAASAGGANDTAELVLTFEVRIRLPLLEKEII